VFESLSVSSTNKDSFSLAVLGYEIKATDILFNTNFFNSPQQWLFSLFPKMG
jgi:hypothetical protein